MNSSSPLSTALARNARYYGFLVLMLVALSALGSFVNDMYSPALPGMCRFFGCQVPVAQLGLTMGMAGLGVGQLLLGPISDRIGRKPALIGATALFIMAAGVVAQAVSLLMVENLWFYLACMALQMFGAGMIFATANTLAMNEGRAHAGEAAAVIGVTGYIVGGTVSPLVGMANFMHSTAIVSIVLTVFVLLFAWLSRRLPADLTSSNQ